MNKIPTHLQNPKGLHQRYYIQKINHGGYFEDGESIRNLVPVDKDAEYFVMRLDEGGKDPNHIRACRIGVNAYADAIEPFIPELAKDLRERYPTPAQEQKQDEWISEIDKARFWVKVKQTDYCWNWEGGTNGDGYGIFRIKEDTRLAHRISFQIISGSIPDNINVCHTCDNPKCVNPDHLFTGTQKDNMLDKMRKGRGKLMGKSSKYHGVSFRNDSKRWRSFYKINGLIISLGCFENEIDAAKMRDLTVKKLNLDLPLNFP
jgi:hypothetical protein